MSNAELKIKIKKALEDSGFPLELRMSKILKKRNWNHTLCSRYEDFETGVLRELDISAEKIINGISIHLYIECKKSSNKQLILYAQEKSKLPLGMINYVKYFPRIENSEDSFELEKCVINELKNLPILKQRDLMSKSIIFTKGDKIEQNNDSFFTSLNGIIKKSIIGASDGYVETNFRIIFFHILIYDGLIFLLNSSDDEDFELTETDYGQYKFDYRFRINKAITETRPDILETIRFFDYANVIEIMTPKYFERYLDDVEDAITKVKTKNIKRWGEDWDKFIKKYLT